MDSLSSSSSSSSRPPASPPAEEVGLKVERRRAWPGTEQCQFDHSASWFDEEELLLLQSSMYVCV